MADPISILITGPESSGKSTISVQISKFLGAVVVKEYAREYLTDLSRPYSGRDFTKIVNQQQKIEKDALDSDSKYVVLDTGPVDLSIWNKVKYNKNNPNINSWLKESQYDFIFLCNPDFPWQPDPLREHPNNRKELFDLYKNELKKQNLSFDILEGNEKNRIDYAIKKVQQRSS